MKNLTVLLLTLALAACTGLGRNSPPPEIYDFGLPAASLADNGAWARLALEVKAPAWLETRTISYRLAYDNPLKLREYTESRWAGSPTLLLDQRLRQQLGVVSAHSNTAVDCSIRLDVHEFSQVFDTPQKSRAVLYGSVNLVDAKRLTIAERRVAIEQPAPTLDARGGVSALLIASENLGRQLADWLKELENKQVLKRCHFTLVEK